MEINLLEIWNHMGVPARVVFFALTIMGIAVVAVTIERFLAMGRWRADALAVAPQASELLKARKYDELFASLESNQKPLARLIKAGVKSYRESLDSPTPDITAVEFSRRELARTMEHVGVDARRGMSILASVASTAPFVGLFGTVVGIISAFEGIAKAGSGGLGAVSAGIAEALVMTGYGLGVAIPAVLLFNWVTTRVDSMELSLQTATGELADQLEKNYGHDRQQRA